MIAAVLVPVAFASTAGAATSEGVVRDDNGDAVAIVHFNSGMHGFHHGTSNTGVNSFDVLDRCNDGLVVNVVWDVEGEGVSKWEADEDCSGGPLFVPIRLYGVPTGQAWSEMKQVEWYAYVREEGATLSSYEAEPQQDWMGSYSHDPDGEYFFNTSVYMEDYDDGETVVASMSPTEYANGNAGGDEYEDMWDAFVARTPVPDDLTEDEVESMKKQLWCHAQFAWTGRAGPTWDLESAAPNVSWEEARKVGDHGCNWGVVDRPSYPGYWPTGPDDEPPADLVPVVDAGPDVSGDEGSSVTLQGYTADDHGTPDVLWSYEPRPGVDEGATCEFSDASSPVTDITCTDDGEFVVTLTADDGANPPVIDSAVVSLGNVAPALSLDGPADWDVYRIGDDTQITAPFTDPGANDAHTCTVAWDDGTSSEFESEDGKCDVSHAFEDAGMYTVDVKVADDDGTSDTASVMVVVYDPRAGLLAGAGTVDDATFVTAAKYPSANSTDPLGSVVLEIPTDEGERTLVSTDLEWLVITPDGKAAVKGESVNYGFVGYAEAGRFRGVVWPLSEGDVPPDEPVYDTSPGASWDIDDAEPAAASTGTMIIDTGWIPGLPTLPDPISDILDDLPDLGIELPGLPLLPGLL